MSCVKPLKAYWRSASRDGITFDAARSATKIPFAVPCGRCIGCRMEKARQWGIRCLHEAKMWPQNSYVTLTYDDAFMPDSHSLCLRDVQLFMKRLRKRRKSSTANPIRFFLGGEYGDTNLRPHYHALLFNCGFPDARVHGTNKRGENLYTSAELSELWFQGFSTIGEVTFESAVYCAKYALKKISGDKAFEHYNIIDEDGVVLAERKPEFAVMSRRPGIGKFYYEKFGNEVRAHDNVIVSGREVRPPRYYDSETERVDPARLEQHKRRRKRLAVLCRLDNTPARLRVKEELMVLAAKKKERTL